MITLAMLVKDPPLDRLAALLDYVALVVGQVVIVVDDRTSDAVTDAMHAMSRTSSAWAGVQQVSFRWIDDFAAARNAALPYCTGDWILHLDPDELPSADMLAFLGMVDRSEWRSPPQAGLADGQGPAYWGPLGYLFWTRNLIDGAMPGMEQDWHCRLFRRGLGRWYKSVHEQVELSGLPEHVTRETPLLPKAPMSARLIHAPLFDSAKEALYNGIEARA